MTGQQKAPDAANVSGLGKTQASHCSEAQRRRLLDRLRIGPISTLEARRDLDILMPAARIFELRECGHRIVTFRIDQCTDAGTRHKVARYVLQSGNGPDADLQAHRFDDRPTRSLGGSDGKA